MDAQEARERARKGWDARYSRLAMILGDWEMVEAMKVVAPPTERGAGEEPVGARVVDWLTTGVERPMPFEEEGAACALRG